MKVKLSVFREVEFAEGSRPSLSTLRRWIDAKELPGGEKLGKHYFVEMDVYRARGNPLVLKVLRAA